MSQKTIRNSYVQHKGDVSKEDLNQYEVMHGGRLLTLCDEVGYLAAKKHAECDCLTRAVHQAQFRAMLKEGDTFTIEAKVVLCGNSTLWTDCQIKKAGESVMSALFVYIAVDKTFKPVSIPPVYAENESEQALQAQVQAFRDRVLKAGTIKP